MRIFFRIMCKKNHDCRSFFDRDIKFQSIYFKIEQNSREIYNRENLRPHFFEKKAPKLLFSLKQKVVKFNFFMIKSK
jgi:hypothetical protein